MLTQGISSKDWAAPHKPICSPKVSSLGRAGPSAATKQIPIRQTILELMKRILEVPHHLDVTEETAFTDIIGQDGRIGMDSASLLLFKSALEQELVLPAPIPITSLMRADTVNSVEAEIMKLVVSSSPDILLPFATQGTGTPLFLFPPGGGELHCWIGLVKHLPNRPIYGLRLRGLQPGESPFASMDEMVDCYVANIKAVQPRGPYALLGMCFGGNIAFEVAKRLESIDPKGSVVFVGGVDNAPSITNMSFGSLRYFIVDLLSSRRIIKPSEAASTKSILQKEGTKPSDFPGIVYAKYQSRLQTAGISRERLESWHNVFCGTAEMTKSYCPEGTVQSYVEFWAEPLAEWDITTEDWRRTVARWSDFSKESRFHKITGDHYTALTAAHIDRFQDALNQEFYRHGV